MLKKTTAAAVLALAGSAAFAGTMGPVCTPGNVTVPCEAKKWDIGAEALYWQPAYASGLGYEFNPEHGFNSIRPRWGWGYRLQGSYHFHTGNDITMTYIHYDKDSDRGGYGGEIPFAFAFEPFRLHLQNKFDQVNLVLGQHVDISAWKKMRFYGGLQFAKIRLDQTRQFLAIPPALARRSVTTLQQIRNSDFEGVGPVLGIDYSYNLINGLSVTGNVATSLLYGVDRYVTGYISGPAGVVSAVDKASLRIIVPSIEAKVGLKYTYEWIQGTLNLEGGVQGVNYFNALQSRRPIGQTNYIYTTDFGLWGPYFGATWVGDVV
ncbi:outer membrane protein [Legionella nautarum]|uniref:Outer membrane protein n=1 Tax=Legionella nautarum TaxID=45070 RepID=A0A0W0X1Q7_9GAMM|nr:Lpg1974 family pore-forming outer membrane protein [Legionella nautarum]KTD38503.1 outer membrane protein [Legionella nautarum]